MNKEIKLYIWPHCPYCNKAKELLRDLGHPFSGVNIYNDMEAKNKLEAQTGQRTVPFIFIGDKFIGGYTELKEFNESGELEKLVKS